MHIEVRVSNEDYGKKVFDELRRDLLIARVPLKEVTFESIQSECRNFDGKAVIYAIVYSNNHEKADGRHNIAEKTLGKLGFVVKSGRF